MHAFCLSSLLYDAHIVIFDAFTNNLLSTVHLKYFSAYIHIDVIVESLELSSMHEDVKRCLERSPCESSKHILHILLRVGLR
jgi:hypothetical protein